MLIGVVVPQTEPGDRLMFQNSFYSEVLGSIEYYARQRGYHILISATDANESYLTLAKQRNLDGIIVIGMYPDEFYQQMKKTQIPIVLIDSYCNDHYYNNIRIDDAYGSYLDVYKRQAYCSLSSRLRRTAASAASSRFRRTIRFVKRLLLVMPQYSSGPLQKRRFTPPPGAGE